MRYVTAVLTTLWMCACSATPTTSPATSDASHDVTSSEDAAGADLERVPKPPITCPFEGSFGGAVGDTLGSYELRDCAYNPVELSALACGNEATLIAVGAGWSDDSATLSTQLKVLWDAQRASGLMVVQVLTEDNPGQTVSSSFCDRWTADNAVEYPVLMDQTQATAALFDDISQPPAMILVNRTGVITHRWQGLPTDLETAVEAALR